MMRIIILLMAVLCGHQLSAQSFTTEFSTEISMASFGRMSREMGARAAASNYKYHKLDEKVEFAPQMKGIFEMPFGKHWAMEMELAYCQGGVDYRVDALRAFGPVFALLAGVSSGDGSRLCFGDLGVAASRKKWGCTAIMHYSPLSRAHDKYLELTVQRNFGHFYLQPGLYINHAVRTISLIGVITLGVNLDMR